MMNLALHSQLPATPDVVRNALATLTGERDKDRNPVVRRALSTEEKTALATRSKELDPFADPGTPKKKGEEITAMLMGFGGASLSIDEARLTAVQYARTCQDLPLWAVARACGRFSRGEVRPEEVGQEGKLNLNFRPTTAQLYVVAAAIAKPVMEERYRIGAALRAVALLPKRQLSPEEQAAEAAAIEASRAAYVKQAAAFEEAITAERTGRQIEAVRRARDMTAEHIARDYRAAGLDVPPWQGDMPPASLSLMLSLGWTITEDPHGKKILIAPRKPRDPGPTPRRPESKDLNDEIPF